MNGVNNGIACFKTMLFNVWRCSHQRRGSVSEKDGCKMPTKSNLTITINYNQN